MTEKNCILWELQIDTPEQEQSFKNLFPDLEFHLKRIIPEPDDLVEHWDDNLALWFYGKAQLVDVFGKTDGDDWFDNYYHLPRYVGCDELVDYLRTDYPELVERCSYIFETRKKYFHILDKQEWRRYYWGGQTQPETLMVKAYTSDSNVKYYRFALAFDAACFNIGFAVVSDKLRVASRLWSVSNHGYITEISIINPELASDKEKLPEVNSLQDVGFSLKDFDIKLNRKGNRHILLT